jgi:ABC-type bacteriocin/lantibiotic exporter with double-glycine peptidase domain
MLNGIETLKSAGTEQRAVERWSSLFVDVLNLSLARGRLNAWIDAFTGSVRAASPLVIVGLGTMRVMDGKLSLGNMLALNALAAGVLGPLSSLAQTAGQFQLLGSYAERIEDVLETAPEQDRTKSRPEVRLHGAIELQRVSFRYNPGSPDAVRDVSATVAPGQFVAIVGRSGSGKSTLARLLAGLYTPVSGRILYDGIDLAEADLRAVRRQLGIVTQHPYLFGTTIRANIALADESLPIGAVIAAAQSACIHDDIARMPMSYDTMLVDGGASLAGGQRQRIAIARALARKPPIVLLDEATSALDAVTERAVQDELAKLACTRIVIAHRLSTIERADVILVMDEGQIVERGTHRELVEKSGHYAALVAAQLRTGTAGAEGE